MAREKGTVTMRLTAKEIVMMLQQLWGGPKPQDKYEKASLTRGMDKLRMQYERLTKEKLYVEGPAADCSYRRFNDGEDEFPEKQEPVVMKAACPGGCGGVAPEGHTMCFDCLEGANIVNLNALREAREQIARTEELGGRFSVFLYPYARTSGEFLSYEPLDVDCWWIYLLRVPCVGEELSLFMSKQKCCRETVFTVAKVTTVLDLEEPLSFRVFLKTEDLIDDLAGFVFDDDGRRIDAE